MIFVATWDNVQAYPQNTAVYDTFQMVVGTNGVNTFVMYHYPMGGLNWQYAITNSFGAQVGFDSGNGHDFYSVPGSQSPEVLNFWNRSNVCVSGKFIFDVSEAQVGTPIPRWIFLPPQRVITINCSNASLANLTDPAIISPNPIAQASCTCAPLTVSYNDSLSTIYAAATAEGFDPLVAPYNQAGLVIARTWRALDNCNSSAYFVQYLIIVDPSLMIHIPSDQLGAPCGFPVDDQVNVTTSCPHTNFTYSYIDTAINPCDKYRTHTLIGPIMSVTNQTITFVAGGPVTLTPPNTYVATGCNANISSSSAGTATYTGACSPTLNYSDVVSPGIGCEREINRTWMLMDCDGSSWTAYQDISVVSSPPVGNPDSATTMEDTPVLINILINDADADGVADINMSCIRVVTMPMNGMVTINSNGSVTYMPNSNFFGTDSFNYTVCDNQLKSSAPTRVTVTVAPVEDAPIAPNDFASTYEDTPVVIDVLANDMDPDDPANQINTSCLLITQNPNNGTAIVNPNHTITYTPSPNWWGVDWFFYSICDNPGANVSATVLIAVTSVPDAPVAQNDMAMTLEDTPIVINVLANDMDVDGDIDPGCISLASNATHGWVSIHMDGTVTYTPFLNYHGLDSFSYTVCDHWHLWSNPANVQVTIISVNDAPIAVDDYISTMENSFLIDVLANDWDDDGFNLSSLQSIQAPGYGMVMVNSNGTFTYTYNTPVSNLSDAFVYRICDMEGLCADGTVVVYAPPKPPLAMPDVVPFNYSNGGPPFSFSPLANDGSFVPINQSSLRIVSPPMNGTALVLYNGSIVYFPNPGFYGNDSFVYQICGTNGLCSNATVSLMVPPDPATAMSDMFTCFEDVPCTFSVSLNDANFLSGPEVINTTMHGNLTIMPNHSIQYISDRDYFGNDSFEYKLCNLQGCGTAWVWLEILPLPDCPELQNDYAFISMNETVVIDVLANDTDPDGSNQFNLGSVMVEMAPEYGMAMANPNGTITYMPNPNWHGVDFFIYGVCDITDNCRTATVVVKVMNTNHAPFALDDMSHVWEDSSVNVSVLWNDYDIDGPNDINPCSISVCQAPSHGSTRLHADVIEYIPNHDYFGNDSFVYCVCDFGGLCSNATVWMMVDNTCDAPVAVNDMAMTMEEVPVLLNVLANDYDVDGITNINRSSLWIMAQPGHGSAAVIWSNQTILYTPAENWYGNDSFIYKICDVDDFCAVGMAMVQVMPAADPPIALNDQFAVTVGVPTVLPVLNNDYDSDGPHDLDMASLKNLSMPDGGDLVWNSNGTFTFTAWSGFTSTVFLYEICDTNIVPLCATASVTVYMGDVTSITVSVIPVPFSPMSFDFELWLEGADTATILTAQFAVPATQGLTYNNYTLSPVIPDGWMLEASECQAATAQTMVMANGSTYYVSKPNSEVNCIFYFKQLGSLMVSKKQCCGTPMDQNIRFELRRYASGTPYGGTFCACNVDGDSHISFNPVRWTPCGPAGSAGTLIANFTAMPSQFGNLQFNDLMPGQEYQLCEVVEKGFRTSMMNGFIPPDGCACDGTKACSKDAYPNLYAVVCTPVWIQPGEQLVMNIFGANTTMDDYCP